MTIQTIIISILSILIIIVAFLIVLVGSIGVLRVVVLSVFEFDFIKWLKARVNTKKKNTNDDLPRIYKLNLKGKDDEN